MPPILSFVGHSGSGKTTLLEKLIRALKRRGVRLAVVKHANQGFTLTPGKDSQRLSAAGADHVAVVGPGRTLTVRRHDREPDFQEVVRQVQTEAGDIDLILTEGYKRGPAAKIEVYRRARGDGLAAAPDDLIAIVADERFPVDVPHFGLDDIDALAAFVQRWAAGAGKPCG